MTHPIIDFSYHAPITPHRAWYVYMPCIQRNGDVYTLSSVWFDDVQKTYTHLISLYASFTSYTSALKNAGEIVNTLSGDQLTIASHIRNLYYSRILYLRAKYAEIDDAITYMGGVLVNMSHDDYMALIEHRELINTNISLHDTSYHVMCNVCDQMSIRYDELQCDRFYALVHNTRENEVRK